MKPEVNSCIMAPEKLSTGTLDMSQIDDIKSNATDIVDGLRKLGPDRVVALSVHKSKDLIADLERLAKQLVEQVESLEG
jgi:hypothetical protein